MAQSETVAKILHAATLLFAERGFSETSLRTITGMAEVNLAAVNYHFGSKKALIQAVFSRFLTPLSDNISRRLDVIEQSGDSATFDSDMCLKMLFDAILEVTQEIDEDPQRFMRLLGLAYAQSQEHLRHYIVEQYGITYHRFIAVLSRTLPELDPVSFYWRLYFMMGAAVFTLSSFDAIRSILNSDYQRDTSMDQVINMMVPSMVGLLSSKDSPERNSLEHKPVNSPEPVSSPEPLNSSERVSSPEPVSSSELDKNPVQLDGRD